MILELVFDAGGRDLVNVGGLGSGGAATVTLTRRRAVRIDTLGSFGRAPMGSVVSDLAPGGV